MEWRLSLVPSAGFVWVLALLPATAWGEQDVPRIIPSSSLSPAILEQKRAVYSNALSEVAAQREALHRRHASGNAAIKAQVMAETRALLMRTLLTEIFPAWDGTPWDFNGISEVPGQGAIACGYFVTTTLRDVGFKLPRIKLAQQPSQTIIRCLCEKKTIRVFYDKPLDTIVTYLEQNGPGIYIVGLDCHTGFVVHDGTSKAFIHSSYFKPPRAVISEPLDSDNPLTRSKYRMIGKLFGDELVKKWLMQESITVRK